MSNLQSADLNIDFERIIELISKYDQIKKSGEIKRYNEESTKKDFILPLFEALGWNVSNRAKKDNSVSAEEKISKGRVDYGFRINGIPKFFLEAKSLREEYIDTNRKYVIQAIDYAWLKSCSWAILTNFETIAIINADVRESNVARSVFFVLHPSDFLTDDRFAYLSRESFIKGDLDKFGSKYGKKQFKKPIDKQLLEDMIHFREILSKSVTSNNSEKQLSQDDLDESVQRILDRLIFIRNAEDRELEGNQLQSKAREWENRGKGNLIREILGIYKDYDDKYNSKLFAKHLADNLIIENDTLLEVIYGLNHSNDDSYRYDFSLIESDVLGSIYEQYLGNILKKTPKRARLEESKTHRKEQGIYYTPSYIVDYIVKNTVGEYIKTHTPEEIRNVRILDPACGSGSFLIRAYKELEDYWNGYYKKNKQIPKAIKNITQSKFEVDSNSDSLEFYSVKSEILMNNIFGVDLDPKAVEIAQLNLLLQISERKRRLPLLQNNIKVGNSLIDDPKVSNRAFKWKEEFPEIMNSEGFDIIIGNPPYVRIQNLDEKESEFFNEHYESAIKNYDIYVLFIEESMRLLKKDGNLGFILPSKFINADYGIGIRNVISRSKTLYRFVDFKDVQIFDTATNYTCLLFLKNTENEKFVYQYPVDKNLFSLSLLSDPSFLTGFELKIPVVSNTWILSDNKSHSLMQKIAENGIRLGEIAKDTFVGMQTSADGIYFVQIINETKQTAIVRNIRDGNEFEMEKSILKKLLKGKDIRKWSVEWKGYYVVYPYSVKNGKVSFLPLEVIKESYPLAYEYFKHYEYQLKSRESNRFENEDNWHQYIYRKNLEKFEQPKIITQVLASSNTFALDNQGEYYFVGGGNAGGYGIVLKDEYKKSYYYILALLNSNVLEFYLKNISTPFRGGYFSYGKRFIEQLPIVMPADEIKEEVDRLTQRLVENTKTIVSRGNLRTDETNKITTLIESDTKRLNEIVYNSYGLNFKDVDFVEHFLKGNRYGKL